MTVSTSVPTATESLGDVPSSREQLVELLQWAALALIAFRPSLDFSTGFVVLAIGPVELNAASLLGLALLGVGAAWMVCLPAGERWQIIARAVPLAATVWIGALGLWAIAPVVVGGTAHLDGVREWVRMLCLVPIALIATRLAANGRGADVIGAIIASVVIPAAVALGQIVTRAGASFAHPNGISATFDNPTSFSIFLVLVLAATYWRLRTSRRRWLWAVVLSLQLVLLLCTFSWVGFVMLGLGATACVWFDRGSSGWGVLLAVAAFVILFMLAPGARCRVTLDPPAEGGAAMKEPVPGVLPPSRSPTSETAVDVWWQRKWLGHGLGSVRVEAADASKLTIAKGFVNDHLRYLVETGIVGALIYCLAYLLIGLALAAAVRRDNQYEDHLMAVVALAVFGATVVASSIYNHSAVTAFQFGLWALTAAGASRISALSVGAVRGPIPALCKSVSRRISHPHQE